MPTYSYRPYYQHEPHTHEQFMRDDVSPEEEDQRIAQFISELKHRFVDEEVDIKVYEGIVCLTTDLPQSGCDTGVAECLANVGLQADRVR